MLRAAASLFVFALGLPTAAWAADPVTVSSMDADFTAEQRAKLEQALAVANRVLQSDAFRQQLSAIERFNYARDDGATVQRALLRESHTLEFKAVAKYAIRVRVFGRTYTRQSKMIARTSEGSGSITFNTARMPDFGVAYYAGTIVHELAHLVGYHHSGNRPTRANQRSVPYRVGELVRRLAEADPTTASSDTGDDGTAGSSPPTGGLAGALGGDEPDSHDGADAQPKPRRKTFLARVKRTLARWFGR
jgi:hypothetical protein